MGRDSRLPPITSITTWKPGGGEGDELSEWYQWVEIIREDSDILCERLETLRALGSTREPLHLRHLQDRPTN